MENHKNFTGMIFDKFGKLNSRIRRVDRMRYSRYKNQNEVETNSMPENNVKKARSMQEQA